MNFMVAASGMKRASTAAASGPWSAIRAASGSGSTSALPFRALVRWAMSCSLQAAFTTRNRWPPALVTIRSSKMPP